MKEIKEKVIEVGIFLFKLRDNGRADVVISNKGEYMSIRNSKSNFLEKALLKEMGLDDEYDVFIMTKSFFVDQLKDFLNNRFED